MRNRLLATAAVAVMGLPAHAQSAMAQTAPAYAASARIALPDGGWDLASFDTAMSRVYIARSASVDAIDAKTQTVTQIGTLNRGHAAEAINGGAEVLATNGGSDEATIYDAKTGALVATIKTGQKPDAAMVDAATGLAVVMNAKSGDLTLIDPKAHTVVGQVAIGGSLELGVSLGGGRIAVNVEDKNEVVLVDLKTKTVIKHVALAGCDGPTGVTWMPVSHRILSSCANTVAVFTNPDTGAQTSLPIGKGPDTALYDAKRHLAFVPAGRSGELDIFADTAAGPVAAGKVETQMGARTGAIDPTTGKIYLIAAEYGPPAAAGGRPAMKPGSVVALVVSPK